MALIISEPISWIFQNWFLGCPGPYAQTVFEFLKKKHIFWFFIFVNMGPYGSKTFKTLLLPQIAFESCLTFSEISSQWSSQKYCFGFVKFWVYDFSGIFFIFVKHETLWETNFKMLLLPQITFESFQTFPEFSSQWSSQKYCFKILSLRFFTICFHFR